MQDNELQRAEIRAMEIKLQSLIRQVDDLTLIEELVKMLRRETGRAEGKRRKAKH